MTDAFWIALFSGLPGIIAAITAAIIALKQGKMTEHLNRQDRQMDEIKHAASNGIQQAAVSAAKAVAEQAAVTAAAVAATSMVKIIEEKGIRLP